MFYILSYRAERQLSILPSRTISASFTLILQNLNQTRLAFLLSMGYHIFSKRREEGDNKMTEFYWSPLADLEDLIYESEFQNASER